MLLIGYSVTTFLVLQRIKHFFVRATLNSPAGSDTAYTPIPISASPLTRDRQPCLRSLLFLKSQATAAVTVTVVRIPTRSALPPQPIARNRKSISVDICLASSVGQVPVEAPIPA